MRRAITDALEGITMANPRSGRSYAGAGDLRRMQSALSAAPASTGLHVGDLAWLARVHTHRELSLDIRLWDDDDGHLTGWTFFRANGGFNLFLAPNPISDAAIDDMLAAVEAMAAEAVAAGDPPVALYTYGIDPNRSESDRALAAGLERHGYARTDETTGIMTRNLADLPAPGPPDGYALAAVETTDHVRGRVEAHRAAFAPSELTLRAYERVRRTWPYRAELDRVAIAGDGEVVAFCTAWIDDRRAAGLLEPVGTHPDHRQRGLARAVCLSALTALRDAGAQTAQVGFATDAAHALYRSLGFTDAWADITYRKATGTPS
jgi:ribosomal protein S18 acetylase RimI-like enzyme